MWRVWCNKYETNAELLNGDKYALLTPEKNIILKALRSWVVIIGDPTYDGLYLAIYSNRGTVNAPIEGKLIAEGGRVAKADVIASVMLTDPHGHVGFASSFDNVSLRKDESYIVKLKADTYTGTVDDTSYLAWTKGWPDPVYDENAPVTYTNFGVVGYHLALIGSEL